MIVKQEMILDFIGMPDTRLAIPVYQRVYAWSDRQCETLWRDLLRAGRSGSMHFFGTVLYAEQPDDSAERRIDIIDGQQRIATLSLLLAALRDHLRETGMKLDGIDSADIDARYLHVRNDEPAEKLMLSRADRSTFAAIIAASDLPDEEELSQNVCSNYRFFRTSMKEDASADAIDALWCGLQRLGVVSARIDASDRPQLVFESLNAKGMPLTTADLVRNLVLSGLGYDEQTRLYETYWASIENLFGNDPAATRLNAALHGWLAVTAPHLRVSSQDDVYDAFRTYQEQLYRGTREELLIGLKGFCETFAAKTSYSSSQKAQAHAQWGNGKVEGIISEKKLFGD